MQAGSATVRAPAPPPRQANAIRIRLDQHDKRIRLASLPLRLKIQRLQRQIARLTGQVGELTRENEVLRGELAVHDEEPLRLDHPDDDWGT